MKRCGLGCLTNSECLGSDGCQLCENNICVFGFPGGITTLISSEKDLRDTTGSGKDISLCENLVITLSQELVVSTAITIQGAKSHTCTIQGGGGGNYRLITFTSGNIKVDGIAFQNGGADGDVSFVIFLIYLFGFPSFISSKRNSLRTIFCPIL